MMRVIALPPIIGNLLTFITMQRGSLKSMSTCFYMAILGVADIGAFHFYILLTLLVPISDFSENPICFKLPLLPRLLMFHSAG